MINLFQIAANDQSLYYLGQVFGYVGDLLPAQGASMLLGTMFKTFNVIVLAVGALIVIYTTVVGVLMTANDGQFMGQKWGGNSIWIPIRMVIGIAALVPIPSGYSTIQVIMMWIVVQGIGAADMIWTTTLNYIDAMGSPYAGVVTLPEGMQGNLQTLFQGLVCQVSAQQTYANPAGSSVAGNKGPAQGGYFCALNPADPFCKKATPLISPEGTTYSMGPGASNSAGACGQVTYCNLATACGVDQQNSIACAACTAQQQILRSSIIPTFLGIAQSFVTADYQYRVFSRAINSSSTPGFVQSYCNANSINPCCQAPALSPAGVPNTGGGQCQPFGNGAFPTDTGTTDASNDEVDKILWPFVIQNLVGQTNFIQASSNAYAGAIETAMINQQLAQGAQPIPQLHAAQTNGWLFAGAYYYTIAALNNKNLSAANPAFSVVGGDAKSTFSTTYRTDFSAANELMNQMASAVSGSSSSSPGSTTGSFALPGQLSAVTSGFGTVTNGIMSAFMNVISGSKPGGIAVNPLAALQSFGAIMLTTVAIATAVLLGIIIGISLLGYIDVSIFGNFVQNPIGGTITTISIWLMPIVLFFAGTFVLLGGLLAVYTPLIPYIIFLLGTVSWFILVIEAMVAAPLVALGILAPSGQHEVLGHAHHAIMYAFSLFLRPGLMIFGMMASMLLASAAVTLLNSTFSGVMSLIDPSGGILELVFFIGIYVALVIVILNKCFALIHIIPDRVLRWMGHHGDQTDVESGLAQAKAGGEALSGQVSRAGGATAKGAAKHLEGQAKGAKESADKSKSGGPGIT